MKAAAYLQSPLILDALIAQYFFQGIGKTTRLTVDQEDNVAKKFKGLDVPEGLKRTIAQQYFLRTHWSLEDFVPEFKKFVAIPLADLIAYECFSTAYVKAHPELLSDSAGRQKLFLESLVRVAQLPYTTVWIQDQLTLVSFLRLNDVNKNGPDDQVPLIYLFGKDVLYSPMGPIDTTPILYLLMAGADPNKRDRNGRTPVTALLQKTSRSSALRALLDGGADPNLPESVPGIPANQQWTPLMYSALIPYRQGNYTFTLLKAGASIVDAKQRFLNNNMPAAIQDLDRQVATYNADVAALKKKEAAK